MSLQPCLGRLGCITLTTLALLFGGCATPSKPTAMVADAVQATNRNHASVVVNVTGGAETSSLGASNIANQDFAEAIKSSITQSGLFSSVAGESGDYQLNAQIVRLDRPMFGISFTVNMEVTWRLLRTGNQAVVWEKAISSSFTATMGDAFAGVTRLRLANEGAARANIQDAITQMGALTLP